MATWVLAGHRKLNLDTAAWVDRSDNGDVHVVFDGALNHTFRGDAADNVWKLVAARSVDPTLTAAEGASTNGPRARKRAR
jgi:hypothetical protein